MLERNLDQNVKLVCKNVIQKIGIRNIQPFFNLKNHPKKPLKNHLTEEHQEVIDIRGIAVQTYPGVHTLGISGSATACSRCPVCIQRRPTWAQPKRQNRLRRSWQRRGRHERWSGTTVPQRSAAVSTDLPDAHRRSPLRYVHTVQY